MELLSKEEILKYLEDNKSCESTLSEIVDCDLYFILYANTLNTSDFYHVGQIFVKCTEGFLAIPINGYDSLDGYEQLDISDAKIMDKEYVSKCYQDFDRQRRIFENFIA